MGNILFSNPYHGKFRVNGTLQLSHDDGKTWSRRVRYSDKPHPTKPYPFSGYSDIALINSQDIAVLFERGGMVPIDFKKGRVQIENKNMEIRFNANKLAKKKPERWHMIDFKIIPIEAFFNPEMHDLVQIPKKKNISKSLLKN